MFWYIGYFLTHREPTERQPPVCLAREALCLLKAEDSDAAYVKCFEVAEGAAEGATGEGMGTWTPAGIMDLLKLMDDPAAVANWPGRRKNSGQPSFGVASEIKRI